MSEQEPMDRLLRQSMSTGPLPRLSPDFDRRLANRLRPRRRLNSRGRVIMTIYTLAGLIASVWMMRSQSIGWLPIAVAITAPLVITAVVVARAYGLPRTRQG
jgi:hypothetical protein